MEWIPLESTGKKNLQEGLNGVDPSSLPGRQSSRVERRQSEVGRVKVRRGPWHCRSAQVVMEEIRSLFVT